MLTDAHCRNAICPPEKKRERLSDSGGLYLEVSPNGSKRWFWKYRLAGLEKRLALGSYPESGLTAARKARDLAKQGKADGTDLAQVRKVEKLKATTPTGDTFRAVALEWYAMKLDSWSSHYAIREKRNLEKDLFPFLGERRIGEIEPIELLAIVRRVEERGALDVAHRVVTTAGQVWRCAVATARAPRDVSADIRGALKPHHGKHFAATTDPKKLGELLRAMHGYQGGPAHAGVWPRCAERAWIPGDRAHLARGGTERRPAGDRGAASPFRQGRQWPRLQPYPVPQTSHNHDAAMGRLPRQAAQGRRRHLATD